MCFFEFSTMARLASLIKSFVAIVVATEAGKMVFKSKWVGDLTTYDHYYFYDFFMVVFVVATLSILMDMSVLLLGFLEQFRLTKRMCVCSIAFAVCIGVPTCVGGIVLNSMAVAAPASAISGSLIKAFQEMQMLSRLLKQPGEDYLRHEQAIGYKNHRLGWPLPLDKNDSKGRILPYPHVESYSSLVESVHALNNRTNQTRMKRLDKLFDRISTAQRDIGCCGLDGANDWLLKFSGTFGNKTRLSSHYLWWVRTNLDTAVPPSCCRERADDTCNRGAHNADKTDVVFDRPFGINVVGCRIKLVQMAGHVARVLAACMGVVAVMTLPSAAALYFLAEQEAKRERLLRIDKWQQQEKTFFLNHPVNEPVDA